MNYMARAQRDPLDVETERLKARMAQIRQFRGSALPNAAMQLALMHPLDGSRRIRPTASRDSRINYPRSIGKAQRDPLDVETDRLKARRHGRSGLAVSASYQRRKDRADLINFINRVEQSRGR